MTPPRGLTAVTNAWISQAPTTPAAGVPLPAAGPTAPAGNDSGLEPRANTTPAGAPHVIGVDPSLTGTGIASSHGWCQTRGYVKPKSKDPSITQLPHRHRLIAMTRLADEITTLIGQPDLVVMEAPAFTRSGGGAHERAWLWWELYRHMAQNQVPVAIMTIQSRLMYATGKGSGTKGAVIDAVSRRWPMFATGGNDNLADAVVFCAAGMDQAGHALAVVPATHRRALEAVAWPPGRWSA